MTTTFSIPGVAGAPATYDLSQTGLTSALGAPEQPYDNHMDWDGGGWFMFGMMAFFWIGMVALGWWAISSYNRHRDSDRQSPADVARHRYARGEINAEEFERLKRDLG